MGEPEQSIEMIRTVFMIGIFALLAIFVLGKLFAVFGTLLAIALGLAIKVLIVGAIIYLVIRVVSPETARRLRSRFSGPSF